MLFLRPDDETSVKECINMFGGASASLFEEQSVQGG
jgi:hypothetical protein